MEFWGVEVKHGEPLKVSPGDGMVLHLSQASLGELKKEKGNESICLFLNVDGKKLVLGTLFSEKLPQQQFDLVFDQDFELSHNWKSGSVYFYGYKANNPFEEDELLGGEFEDSESEEDVLPLNLANNGKPKPKSKKDKSVEAERANAAKENESGAAKQNVKFVEPSKIVNLEGGDSSDDGTSEDDFEDDSEDEDDSDDSSDDGSEETPKVEISKKRPAESASKTPATDKKAKVAQPKTDGKKSDGHVATPHPAKQAGKTPATKPNPQTPKSGGSHPCKSCTRAFGSEQALESHTKAKHGK